MEENNTDYQFEDVEKSSHKALTIKEIMLKQLSRCLEEGSKEMTLGGVNTRVINGVLYHQIVPNQVEIFVNTIDMFYSVLHPYILKHKEFELRFSELDDGLVAARKKFSDTAQSLRTVMDNYKEETTKERYTEDYNRKVNMAFQNRELEILELYKRNLLLILSDLLFKLNYLDDLSSSQ